ncbi:MAG: SIMPL domain-containing protein [Halanaerobium sp.]
MNRNVGMFLVFIALILLSVIVVNGLYFNTPAVETAEREEPVEKVEEDYITTNLSINQQQEYDPEVAEVVLGFENENREQQAAVAENNRIVSKLMAILEESELENIETQGFRVYPYTNYVPVADSDDQEERVTFYRVSNQIKFSTKNLAELPVLLGELLNAGANRVVNINYRLESNEQALEEVTASALSSLKDKAAFMAENLDKENYRIKKLNFAQQNIYGSDVLKAMTRTAEASEFSEVPLAEQKVNINVSVSAEIELY